MDEWMMVAGSGEEMMDIVQQRNAQAVRREIRGAVLQSGAIGDCILTLPLVDFMKKSLGLGGVDMIGHTEYIGMLPGRSCVDGVRSIDSLDIHRLFARPGDFELVDRDVLINAFGDYAYVVTFLGEPSGDFEQNLIYTANCSHSAEVMTILHADPGGGEHVSDFHMRQFIESCESPLGEADSGGDREQITALESDRARGAEILKAIGVEAGEDVVVIAPGASGLEKCWYVDNFLDVARQVQQKSLRAVFVLGPAELERFEPAVLAKIENAGPCVRQAALVDVLGVLSRSGAFVGNDSGLSHLAGAMGLPTVTVFGPTDPAIYAPRGPKVTVLRPKNECFSSQADAEATAEVVEAVTGRNQ